MQDSQNKKRRTESSQNRKNGKSPVVTNVYVVGFPCHTDETTRKDTFGFFESLPDNIKLEKFDTITDLVVHVFQLRMLGDLHFEKYQTLIIHNETATNNTTKTHELDRLNTDDLQKLFTKIFGLLQFTILSYIPSSSSSSSSSSDVDSHHGAPSLSGCIAEYSRANDVLFEKHLKTRLKRVHHWCFHDKTKTKKTTTTTTTEVLSSVSAQCNQSLYSMYNQLSILSSTNDKQSDIHHDRLNPSILLRHIDFQKMIQLPPGHNSDFYNKYIDTWDFSASDLSISELIQLTFNILYPLLSSFSHNSGEKNLVKELLIFVFIIEANYHQDNKFHNFKHAVDVLQAAQYLFQHLLGQGTHIGMLTLLSLSALGHDVGHPGTNNKIISANKDLLGDFLESSDESILEKIHCKIFWYILRDFPLITKTWNSSYHEHLNDIIMATDMAKHQQYVEDLAVSETNLLKLSPTLFANPKCLTNMKNEETDENGTLLRNHHCKCKLNKQSLLLLELIIKAADISNVTRSLEISAKWAYLITLEFNECDILTTKDDAEIGEMPLENNIKDPIGVTECLRLQPGIPYGQLFFINTFAQDLFSQLSSKFPKNFAFLEENLLKNKKYWEEYISSKKS